MKRLLLPAILLLSASLHARNPVIRGVCVAEIMYNPDGTIRTVYQR